MEHNRTELNIGIDNPHNTSVVYSVMRLRVLSNVQRRLTRMRSLTDDEVRNVIWQEITEDRDSGRVSDKVQRQMSKELFNRIRRLDVLSELLDDDSITEIMINGTDEIFVEKNGRIGGSGLAFESKERLYDIVGQIASGVNRSVNMRAPILDARLKDGSRVNIVLDPVALNGPIVTIRRFPRCPVDVRRLLELGSITQEVIDFIKILVRAKYNILISGGTGSGKTTFLNICSGFIGSDERIITIEDSAELRIMNIRNLVRMETRNATEDGCSEIAIRDLIRSALRMRPDRIIVGEVRGEEAIDMLQAFSVGQDGSLSTIHANNAQDALHRLETMIMLSTQIPINALRRQIASGVDIIIQLGRLRDKSRHLLEVREVIGMQGDDIITQTLFRFVEQCEKNGRIMGDIVREHDLYHIEKLQKSGLVYGA